MPSFLHGSLSAIQRSAKSEGLRCGRQYQQDGSFPQPRELRTVPHGEVVLTHEVTDFEPERPAWRLYMTSKVIDGLCDTFDWQNSFQLSDAYEEFSRETAWGALYFTLSQVAPMSSESVAQRLQAVLRFWEPLSTVRYLFKTLHVTHTLEELMVASCDWALEAWSPGSNTPVRIRLGQAAERMARATREDCIQVILDQMPRILAREHKLNHRAVLADPTFLHERLTTLDPMLFNRMSAACTPDVLAQLVAWDRQLDMQ
jgi:hypothetical protein